MFSLNTSTSQQAVVIASKLCHDEDENQHHEEEVDHDHTHKNDDDPDGDHVDDHTFSQNTGQPPKKV